MNQELTDLYSPDNSESIHEQTTDATTTEPTDVVEDTTDVHASISSANLGLAAYVGYKATQIPAVKDKIDECKEAIASKFTDTKDAVAGFLSDITDDIKDFSTGVYDSVSSFFNGTEKAETREFAMYSKEFTETREFGIEHCVEAACELFNEGVISNWANLSVDERACICYAYADEVAKAFELENYKGVIFEDLEPGVYGYNSGDGYIHLTTELLNPLQSPLQLVDTITHELRHQYQSECVNGHHYVADEVRNEWKVATDIYTTDMAWCYDPWGYMYNPLEIDSRYAGETVVRELSSIMFNNLANA